VAVEKQLFEKGGLQMRAPIQISAQ